MFDLFMAATSRAVWSPPTPNSAVLLAPGVPWCRQSGRRSVSASSGSLLPIRRMFGQSALCTHPVRSHQSQLSGLEYLALTDFSMTAIVFDSPSDTDAG